MYVCVCVSRFSIRFYNRFCIHIFHYFPCIFFLEKKSKYHKKRVKNKKLKENEWMNSFRVNMNWFVHFVFFKTKSHSVVAVIGIINFFFHKINWKKSLRFLLFTHTHIKLNSKSFFKYLSSSMSFLVFYYHHQR